MRGSELPAVEKPRLPAAPATRFDRLFPGSERLELGGGSCCRRLRFEIDSDGRPTRQGYVCPAEAWGGPPTAEAFAALTGDPRWLTVDPSRVVYLDTETTQLSTAAGVYAFLVGLGHFEGSRFVLEQYFMEDFAAEPALVEHLDQAMAGAQALVTYNGRCFDMPLLETRWRMQRRPPRFPELHLDLLHYARRLWRLRLPGCGLGEVERHILGIRRLSDIEGALIPRIYLDYIRGFRPERLVPVFDHHAQDIVSLGALAATVARGIGNPDDPRFAHAEDQWGLARMLERRQAAEAALLCMERAVLAARDEDFGYRLAMHLARCYKRAQRMEEAVAIWEARAAQCRPHRLEALINLAMHAEHVRKDPQEARNWTERALGIARQAGELRWMTGGGELNDTKTEQQIEALLRRIQRLEKKLVRTRDARA